MSRRRMIKARNRRWYAERLAAFVKSLAELMYSNRGEAIGRAAGMYPRAQR